jgi:GNAT superfamily N-acetyltransferase
LRRKGSVHCYRIHVMYKKTLPQGYIIQNTQPEHAEQLDMLQRVIFPTLSDEERMKTHHYLHHIKLFPEGQFVVLDGDKAIGMSTTIRYYLTLEDHSFLDISDNLWMNTHKPDGDWLYGMDVGVHPDYRGQRLARAIYQARQETCVALGLRGQITVGMPNGYLEHADRMTLDEYYEALVAGHLTDPTVTVQQKMGFEFVRLIHNYLVDPQCGNGGVLMVCKI